MRRVGLFALAIGMGDDELARAQVEAVRGRRDELNMIGARIQAAPYQGRLAEARRWQPSGPAGWSRKPATTALASRPSAA